MSKSRPTFQSDEVSVSDREFTEQTMTYADFAARERLSEVRDDLRKRVEEMRMVVENMQSLIDAPPGPGLHTDGLELEMHRALRASRFK